MKAKEWISDLRVYEPGKPIEEVARELGFDDIAEIVKVASNENELGPSPMAVWPFLLGLAVGLMLLEWCLTRVWRR